MRSKKERLTFKKVKAIKRSRVQKPITLGERVSSGVSVRSTPRSAEQRDELESPVRPAHNPKQQPHTMTFDVTKHFLVPKHQKLSEAEAKKVLERYAVDLQSLPKILKDDPVIAKLSVKGGDIIKIERSSKTAGTSVYYRVVTHE